MAVKTTLFPLRNLTFSVRGRFGELLEFLEGDLLGDSCGLSHCGSEVLSGVLVVSDVLVSPFSSVVVMSVASVWDSNWENLEPQSFSFSRKRRAVWVENQENMSREGTAVKAPPASRRKMPPTPQSSRSSRRTRKVASLGSSRVNVGLLVVERLRESEQYLNKSDSTRVGVEELESLFGPEDSELDSREILRYARKEGGRIFDTPSSKGQSEHLASRVRWDERQRRMATQEEEARSNVQEVDNVVNQNWIAVYQLIAKRLLKYLEGSEALKVSTRELKEHVLSKRVER